MGWRRQSQAGKADLQHRTVQLWSRGLSLPRLDDKMTRNFWQIMGIYGCYAALAFLALASGGCLWAVAGAAAGGVACHAYYKGKVCQVYLADLNDAWAATHTALTELGMKIEKEEPGSTHGVIRTHTGDGDPVRIRFEREENPVPAEGPMTRICVRVATFGDHPLSERILYQISAHLVAAPAAHQSAPSETPAAGTPCGSPSPPAPPSSEPPLAR